MDPPNENSDTKSKPPLDPPNDDGSDDLDAERKDILVGATGRLNPLQLLLQNRQLSIEDDLAHEESRRTSSTEDLVTDVNDYPSECVVNSGAERTSYENGDNLNDLLPYVEEMQTPREDASATNEAEEMLIDLLDVDRSDEDIPQQQQENPLDPSADELEVSYLDERDRDTIQVDPMDNLYTTDPPADLSAHNDDGLNYTSEGYVSNTDPDELQEDITRTEDAPIFNEVDPNYDHISSTDPREQQDDIIRSEDAPSFNEAASSYNQISSTNQDEEQDNITRTDAPSVNEVDPSDTDDIEFELSNDQEKTIIETNRGDATILDSTSDFGHPPSVGKQEEAQSTATVSRGNAEVRKRKSAGSNESQGSVPLRQMDPPEDEELGNNSQQYIPLMANTARASTSSQTSKNTMHAKSLDTMKQASSKLISKIQVLFLKRAYNIRLAALIIMLGVLYVAVDHFDLKSLYLEKTTLSYAQFSYRLSKADLRLKQKLDDEYGTYSSLLFKSYGFTSNSLNRLRRRMIYKILYAGHLREEKSDRVVDFTWVTAGDGDAAGYGNLFDQAYTRVIEDTVRDSFDAVGLRFVANNFGMDGMSSGPELALCMESIYGFDVDILSWDFHETDMHQTELYQLWANRAGTHPSLPTMFLQKATAERIKINLQLENVGLSAVAFQPEGIRKLMPNSSTKDLPPALRNYKCGDSDEVEQGDCEAYKYDMSGTSCKLDPFQKKTRSGWKDHLLMGRAIGVFLIQQLKLAVEELEEDSFSFSVTKMTNISLSQQQDREMFMSSSLHEVHKGNHVSKDTEFLGGLGRFSPFWKTSAYCRTALLPNQARYDGISTMGSRGERQEAGGGFHSGYEIGYSIHDLPSPKPHKSKDLMIVYTPEYNRNCSVTTHIDYKDFFAVRMSDG